MLSDEPNADAVDARALLAAGNNADLYELVFQAHGLGYRRDATLFASEEDPPPYYGNMLTLRPDAKEAQRAEALALTRKRRSVGVKDGFHRLDLSSDGFDLLFEAAWVWAPAESLQETDWEQVRDADALSMWENAWQAAGSPADCRVFPSSLLSDPRVAFLGRRGKDGYDAGCILNRSGGCIGLSNIFGPPDDAEVHAAAAAAEFAEGLPVVVSGSWWKLSNGALRAW